MTHTADFPRVIVGAWQLSLGHHNDGPGLDDSLDRLERIVELQRGAAAVAFDCADIYSGVEEALGMLGRRLASRVAAADLPPLRFHTKLVPDRSKLAEVDRPYIEGIVDRSLQRLGVERLDLVQFAWWDYDVPGYVECGQVLEDLRKAGKIGQVGATNFDVVRLREIVEAGVPIASHQIQYSALDHRAEPEMTSFCQSHGIATLCYGTLAGGFLTGRWFGKDDPAPRGLEDAMRLPSRSLTKYRLVMEEYGGWPAYQRLLAVMQEIATVHDSTIAQVAMAYALSRPSASSIIAGVTRPDRWSEALGAEQLRLTDEEQRRVRALAATASGPGGPVFGLERAADSPHAAIMKYDLNAGVEAIG